MQRRRRHQQDRCDGDAAQSCGLHDFGIERQFVECRGRHGDQLKSQQGLTAGNDDPGLGQHLLDSCRKRRWAGFFGHGPSPSFSDQPCKAEPEKPCQSGAAGAHREAGHGADDALEYDEQPEPQARGEWQQGPRRKDRCRAFKAPGRPTGLDDSMLHRGRNQASDRQHHQHKRRADQILRRSRERLKAVLENAFEQKPEQHLRSQYQQARFVQGGFYSPVQFHDGIRRLAQGGGRRARPDEFWMTELCPPG
jgi:hypothetical protein